MSTMTPSKTHNREVTDGQIDKAVNNYREMLRKHHSKFDGDAVQIALGLSVLAEEQFSVFRKKVEAVRGMIVRETRVDRSLLPSEVMSQTGAKEHTVSDVVKTMPKGIGLGVTVVFFEIVADSRTDYFKEYAKRGLVPADPFSLAAVNRDDSAFCRTHRNLTLWKGSDGDICHMEFNSTDGSRWVDVRKTRDGRRIGRLWLAGLRPS